MKSAEAAREGVDNVDDWKVNTNWSDEKVPAPTAFFYDDWR